MRVRGRQAHVRSVAHTPTGRSTPRRAGRGWTGATRRSPPAWPRHRQRRATLDQLVVRFSGHPTESLDAAPRAALRLGMFELCFLDRAAHHAAVGEAVELSKTGGRGGHRLVNAVLWRAAREGREVLAALPDDSRRRRR
jgi:NusB family